MTALVNVRAAILDQGSQLLLYELCERIAHFSDKLCEVSVLLVAALDEFDEIKQSALKDIYFV